MVIYRADEGFFIEGARGGFVSGGDHPHARAAAEKML